MVAGILLHPYAFLCLQALIASIMLLEFYKLLWGVNHKGQQIIGLCTAFLLLLAASGMLNYLCAVIPLILMFVWQLYRKDQQPFLIIAQNSLAVLYIALPVVLLSYFVYDAAHHFNGKILLACFIILWMSDVGAYFFGIVFGRQGKHKLFPSVSPRKSWEGFIGGFCMALAAGYILSYYWLPFAVAHCLVIAALISVFGVWGDLCESLLKRSLGVKDSGHIMPGHGGMLDRFDAALFAMPAALLYMKLMTLL
jgi:phosphatidate cytidylyltransferase